VTAWSTGLRRREGDSPTAGVSPVGSSQLAIRPSYPSTHRANRRAISRCRTRCPPDPA
jgi:hypothetical protein